VKQDRQVCWASLDAPDREMAGRSLWPVAPRRIMFHPAQPAFQQFENSERRSAACGRVSEMSGSERRAMGCQMPICKSGLFASRIPLSLIHADTSSHEPDLKQSERCHANPEYCRPERRACGP
jgi:hypothetical protein